MPVFVVHEHHAKRLHYDLRLEMEGVLKSWALPKGPSMDPADRRLAILVDDHDLDYAGFEGTIAEGEYGAGQVAIWDKGEFELKKGSVGGGKIEFRLGGGKLKGMFALLRMKGRPGQWLLVKMKDGLERPGFRLEQVIGKNRKERV